MKQVSVREVQHHLAAVLARVQEGEEVEITRRDVVVARIVPAVGVRGGIERGSRPNYGTRLRMMYGTDGPAGSAAADEISRGRSRDE